MPNHEESVITPVSLGEAMLPLATMFVCMVGAGMLVPIGSEILIVVLIIASTVAGLIAVRHGHDWDAIQRATGKKLAGVLPAILILLTIGVLIGTWMLSGTIPMLVYYGIQWINPNYIVLTAFLATGLMSLTGSSWAAAGTIGVALMGVAASMGAPLPATAGAVLSGAYFGDKLSPLSDQTNLCALAAKANLYDHIRSSLYTALPAFILALVVYFLVGAMGNYAPETVSNGNNLLLQQIEQSYQISGLSLLPALVVIIGTLKKYPAALAMLASSVVALIVGTMLHGFTVHDAMLSAISGFNTDMIARSQSGLIVTSDALTSLLNRGGAYSMANTIILICVAFVLAGAMEVSGALNRLLEEMLKRARSVFGLIGATMASGATLIGLTSHGGVAALVVGGLFQDAYEKQGLEPENLSRTLGDSITMVDPLLPWTVSGLFMATTLGVPTLEYLPWAVFCVGGIASSFLIALTYSKTGIGLRRLTVYAPTVHGEPGKEIFEA